MAGSIACSEIERMVFGAKTFAKKGFLIQHCLKEWRCFTLVTTQRSWDFVVEDDRAARTVFMVVHVLRTGVAADAHLGALLWHAARMRLHQRALETGQGLMSSLAAVVRAAAAAREPGGSTPGGVPGGGDSDENLSESEHALVKKGLAGSDLRALTGGVRAVLVESSGADAPVKSSPGILCLRLDREARIHFQTDALQPDPASTAWNTSGTEPQSPDISKLRANSPSSARRFASKAKYVPPSLKATTQAISAANAFGGIAAGKMLKPTNLHMVMEERVAADEAEDRLAAAQQVEQALVAAEKAERERAAAEKEERERAAKLAAPDQERVARQASRRGKKSGGMLCCAAKPRDRSNHTPTGAPAVVNRPSATASTVRANVDTTRVLPADVEDKPEQLAGLKPVADATDISMAAALPVESAEDRRDTLGAQLGVETVQASMREHASQRESNLKWRVRHRVLTSSFYAWLSSVASAKLAGADSTATQEAWSVPDSESEQALQRLSQTLGAASPTTQAAFHQLLVTVKRKTREQEKGHRLKVLLPHLITRRTVRATGTAFAAWSQITSESRWYDAVLAKTERRRKRSVYTTWRLATGLVDDRDQITAKNGGLGRVVYSRDHPTDGQHSRATSLSELMSPTSRSNSDLVTGQKEQSQEGDQRSPERFQVNQLASEADALKLSPRGTATSEASASESDSARSPPHTMADDSETQRKSVSKKSLMRRLSVLQAERASPASGTLSSNEIAAAQASTDAAMENLVEAQAALRHKVSALMRAGDTGYLAKQMPELQTRTAIADREYKKCLARLPDDLRDASEKRLRQLLVLDEQAAHKEDAIKDAAPVAVKRKMAKAARTGKATRRYSVAIGTEKTLEPVRKPQPRRVRKVPTDLSCDFQVTFDTAGPLGISWTLVELSAGQTTACVKAVKSGSVAEQDGTIQRGMLLAHVCGSDATGMEYFDLIRLIRESRPVTLGFSSGATVAEEKRRAGAPRPARSKPATSTLGVLPTVHEGD